MIAILRRAAGCFIGLVIAASAGHAAIITVDFTGTFNSSNITGLAGSGFNGSFTFTDDSLTGAALTIPSAPFNSGPVVPGAGSVFEVLDGDGTLGEPDSILVEVRLDPGVSSPFGGNVTRWTVDLVDADGMAFPPPFPPDLPDFGVWNTRAFSMAVNAVCGGEGCTADGELTSFQLRQVVAVPEPATLPLLIAALGTGLWCTGRRRERRS